MKQSMRMSYLRGAGLLSLASALVITTPGVMAQTMDDVVVTARKRTESVLDVPIAITAISADTIESAGLTELGDILDQTPGMVYNERDGSRSSAFPGVRGVKTFASPAASAQRISSFVNGMPMVGSQATIQLVDVENVEVYRGPQSAVFGRSVFAGAINYTTRKPDLEQMTGAVNAQLGTDGRQALNGWVSAPIVADQIGVMVSAHVDSYDGPGSPTANDGYDLGGRETTYISGEVLYEPTDALSLSLRYSNVDIDDGPVTDYNLDPATDPNYRKAPTNTTNLAPLYYGALNFADDPVFERNFCYGDETDEASGAYNCMLDPGWEMTRERLEFSTDYEFESGNKLSFKAFQSEDETFDIDDQDNTDRNAGTGYYVVAMGTNTAIEEEYAEVIWTSPDESKLRFTLGASYYDYESGTLAQNVHPTSTQVGQTEPIDLTTTMITNTGIFGGLFYDVTDKLTLSAEGRFQKDEISAEDPNPNDALVPEAITETFLPRVAVNYKLDSGSSLYAQIAKGANPSTVNTDAVGTVQRQSATALSGLTVDGVTFGDVNAFLDDVLAVDEEEILSYEAGFKGSFLDGQLRLNGTVYHIDWDGYTETVNLFFPEGGATANILAAVIAEDPGLAGLTAAQMRVRGAVNIADISINGMEFDGTYFVTDELTLNSTLSYTNAEYDNGCSPNGPTFGLPATTLVVAGGGSLACTTIDGNKFQYTPSVQATFGGTYTTQLSNGWDWFTRGDLRYESKQYMDPFGAGYIPDFWRSNLRTGVSNDSWRVEGYIDNLFDDRTPGGAQYEPARNEIVDFLARGGGPPVFTGLNVASPTPREVGVRVGYKF